MPVQQVGRPVKRVEDPKLITGGDPYVNDMPLAGAATVAFVRSPHAHAVIRRIDTARARALPGVLAVLTGADVNPGIGVIHTPVLPEMFASMNRQGYTMLAEGRVRCVGEPVAVVAAETAQAAEDAGPGGGGGVRAAPRRGGSRAGPGTGCPAVLPRQRQRQGRETRGEGIAG
jgi:carbon-monoxide dehydrogenase large subunit